MMTDFGATKSAARSAPAGISLTEVLISMGIMALGLLGAAALFPVGGHYLRQGDVSDRADAIAQAALSDAVASGLLDPERWVGIRRGNASEPWASVFDRTFQPYLRGHLQTRAARLSGANVADRQQAIQELNQLVGSVYVIDPLGVAEAMSTDRAFSATGPAGLLSEVVGYVPASTTPAYVFPSNVDPAQPGWSPWVAPEQGWPIRRMSVSTGALRVTQRPVVPMVSQAEAMAATTDDLSVELNDYEGNPFSYSADSPSQQRWTRSAVGPLARESRREYSWCLTVVPTTTEARNALATDPSSFSYDVSAVVFHKRVTGETYDATDDQFYGHSGMMLGERQVRAAIGGVGVGGGQVRLFTSTGAEANGPRDAESPLENLRAGQWVLLFGPHPDSISTNPLLFCQWYRVVAVEDVLPDESDGDDYADKDVFLRGPDWPWGPNGNAVDALNATGVANDLRVLIMPDVVAVHTRTMKLHAGSAWGVD